MKIRLGSILFYSTLFSLRIIGTGSTSLFNEANKNLQQSNLNSEYLENEKLNFDEIDQIEVVNQHSAALTTEGKVYTWGSDELGQLGNENDKCVLYKDGKTQLLDIDLNPYEPLIVQEYNFELEQSVSNAESYTIVAKLKNDESIELDKDKVIFEKVKFIESSIPINPSLPLPLP